MISMRMLVFVLACLGCRSLAKHSTIDLTEKSLASLLLSTNSALVGKRPYGGAVPRTRNTRVSMQLLLDSMKGAYMGQVADWSQAEEGLEETLMKVKSEQELEDTIEAAL